MIPVARIFFRLLLRLLFRAELRGYAKPAGKTLIVANHQSFIDGLLIGAFLPFAPTYLVHSQIAAKWHFKILLSFIDHLVIDSTSPLAMKTVIALLESGAPVVIFPEGRITVTGSRMKVYDGPAFAAAKSGAMVLPLHIEGPRNSHFSRMPAGFPRRWFPKVTLTMHAPLPLPMPDAPRARDRRRLASEELRRIMQIAEFDSREETTIPEVLLSAVKQFGKHRPTIEDIRGKEETLGDLLKMTLALGRLTAKWTAEGERVGVLMPTATPTAAMIIGMMSMRRIPAMLNYTSGREGLENACRITEIKTIFASRAFIEKAKLTAMMENFSAARVLYLEDIRKHFGILDKLWLVLFALRFPRAAMKRTRPEDMAVVLFTSGSEGKPKGVALSHSSILANCAQSRAVIEISFQDKFLNALPLFHSFGLVAGLVLPLTSGSRIFLYPSPLHYRVIPEIAYDRDCTVLFATSTFLGNYAKFAHPYDFYKVRYVVSGAEKLSEEVRRVYFEKFGIRILEGYGATECSPIISVNTPMSCEPGSVGEPMPGIECKLAPVEGIETGGELHVHGPNVMMGYFLASAPGVLQPPKSQFGEGWYDTGDIVTINTRRHITIQGRLKRFAKVAGEMVSLEVVERIAVAASPKRMHASATVKEEARGESIILFTDDPDLKRERLLAAAHENGLPDLALPRRIIHLDKVPLLGNGKKDYVKLQAMAAEMAKKVNGYTKREQVGWCMYDFANSAFYTTVITLFLGPYLTALATNGADAAGYVHPFGVPVYARSFWSYAVSLSVILQVIFLPMVGAIADYGRRKKEVLGATAYLGALATIAMFFLQGADYLMGGVLFLIANVAFGAAEVIYNSFLPEIAPPADRDTVSSKGYAYGYIGGGVLLALNLALFLGAAKIGITEGMAVRISLASAGVWWAIFTIPTLLTLHNRGPAHSVPRGKSALATTVEQLAHSLKSLSHYPQAALFLIAFLLFNDAIQTVIALASQFGADELKIPQAQMTLTILMVQFVAFFGSLGFNWVASKTSAKRAVVVSLLIWIAVVLDIFFVTTSLQFFLMAGVVALVLGGSQALSRSLFAQLVPKGREAAYYGVYEITDKGTSWICPIIFGLALQFTKSFRVAILSLLFFFVAGLLVLLKVNVEQGQRDVATQGA